MACMWRKLTSGLPLIRPIFQVKNVRVRTFLSPAYSCTDSWQNRLNSPPLQGLDPNEFSLKLYEKFEKEGKLHAIDVDILANRMSLIDEEHVEFAEHLFYRFRHTNESLKMSSSTPHALIRAYLEQPRIDRLLNILNDKLNYGIFLDYFTANMLLDYFLKEQMYQHGAKIAYEMMLQEDFAHPLTRHLALYACYMHLTNPTSPPQADQSEPPTQQSATSEEEEEEQYIRVKYIDNPWWDDHFDLQKDSHLLGKTLVMIGQMEDSVIGTSSQLIGWGQFEKFEDGIKLLKTALKEKSLTFAKDAIEKFSQSLENAVPEEPVDEDIPAGKKTLDDMRPRLLHEELDEQRAQFQDLLPKLQAADVIVDVDLQSELRKRVEEIAPKTEKADIEEQNKLFTSWNETRQHLLDAQIKEYTSAQKKQEILVKLEQLQEKEELLSYFEQYDKTSLGIKRARELERKTKHLRRRDDSDEE